MSAGCDLNIGKKIKIQVKQVKKNIVRTMNMNIFTFIKSYIIKLSGKDETMPYTLSIPSRKLQQVYNESVSACFESTVL